MHARGYRIADDKRLIGIAPEQVSGDWQASDEHFWIDIQGGCGEALEHYVADVRIDPILMQQCEERSTEMARVIPSEGAIFFALPVYAGSDDAPIGYLAALCLPRLLVTLHSKPIDSLGTRADVGGRRRAGAGVRCGGPARAQQTLLGVLSFSVVSMLALPTGSRHGFRSQVAALVAAQRTPADFATAGAAGSSDLTGGAGGALSGSSSANAGEGALIGAGAGALGGYLYDQHRKTNIG
jgi:hypothetical protein